MFYKRQEFYRSLTAAYPGLVERIKKVVDGSEEKAAAAGMPGRGYLWEHSVLVASLAFRLAGEEKEDGLCASLAALFHDSGKFVGGKYHSGDEAEEEAAARIAREVLGQAGLPSAVTGHVVRSIRSLYSSGARRNILTDILHDSDFLAKSGYLGVAAFFMRSTLRGRTLETTVSEFLSRELTYSHCLPQNMRTVSGRGLALKKSRDAVRFYRDFLAELEDVHNVRFRIRSCEVRKKGRGGRLVSVSLALPVACGSCGGKLETSPAVERGLKCEKLEVTVICQACKARYSISFCLPETA